MAILWTGFYPFYYFNMQDNFVIFVFPTRALVVVKIKSMK